MQDIKEIRSLLYVPCDREKMIDKSLTLKCDGIILDLEDAVSIENKELARKILCSKKNILNNSDRLFVVRINGYDTRYFEEDLLAALTINAAAVIIPKGDEKSVKAAEKFLDLNEKEGQSIKLIPLIETAYCIEYIAQTLSATDRVIAAQFGAEDLTKDLGINRTSKGDEIIYTRNRFTIACRAQKKGAIDTPYTDFNDEAGLVYDTLAIKNMGMTGKTCIHPCQIETVNRLFSPTSEEIEAAKKIVELFGLEENKSKGVVVIDGKMVDAPVFRRAEKVLEKAKLYSLI
jgi:citrate lyase subunit beta/citryl-CoA lyase